MADVSRNNGSLTRRFKIGWTVLALSLAVLGISSVGHAKIIFDPALSYDSTKVTAPGLDADTHVFSADGKVTYLLEAQGIFVGGMVRAEDSNLFDTLLAGPTIGWTSGGFNVAGTYFLWGDRTTSDGTNRKLKDPMGLQVDLYYLAKLTDRLMIGPQMTYRNIRYGKVEVSGTDNGQAYTEQGFQPQIALRIEF